MTRLKFSISTPGSPISVFVKNSSFGVIFLAVEEMIKTPINGMEASNIIPKNNSIPLR
jgi:hypothetical protein